MKNYILKGQILTPVHIGCGEEIEPFKYWVDEKKARFYRIDLDKLLFELDEKKKKEFYEIIDHGNIINLRNFISRILNERREDYTLFTAKVSNSFKKLYNKNINNPKNQLLIDSFIREKNNWRAYLPGSSIKGAIRTAVLENIRSKKNIREKDKKNIEAKILDNYNSKRRRSKINRDPFRTIKIRDAYLPSGHTAICQVFNMGTEGRGSDKLVAKGIQQIYEVTGAEALIAPTEFETELVYDDDAVVSNDGISQKITIDDIIEANKKFYNGVYYKEKNKFYMYDEKILKQLERIEPFFTGLDKNTFIIRVGRFSQVESVTLNEVRAPKTPKGKGWGGTRTLCEKLFPMGWIKVKIEKV